MLLEDQDRTRWNRAQIDEGLVRVERSRRAGARSAYAIQAAIAALHVKAPSSAETDWAQIAQLYRALLANANTHVIALNHAAAVAMAEGPARGLSLLAGLAPDPGMQSYHLFYAARADLLRRLGRNAEATPTTCVRSSWPETIPNGAFTQGASLSWRRSERARPLCLPGCDLIA